MRLRVMAALILLAALPGRLSCTQTKAGAATGGGGKFVTLDHVVAVINGDVLLESDVDEEMHFAALEPFQAHAGKDTRQDALGRLINRTLILQQLKEQQQFGVNISDADVQKSLEELRTHLPQCMKYDCGGDAGWKAFLKANDLTQDEVEAYWKQRLQILQFIDVRFRTGIRIPQENVVEYYNNSVVPSFERLHETAPPLKDVSARIQEVLLQQQVNGLLQDWLKSLRGEDGVRILDPEYAATNRTTGAQEDGEE